MEHHKALLASQKAGQTIRKRGTAKPVAATGADEGRDQAERNSEGADGESSGDDSSTGGRTPSPPMPAEDDDADMAAAEANRRRTGAVRGSVVLPTRSNAVEASTLQPGAKPSFLRSIRKPGGTAGASQDTAARPKARRVGLPSPAGKRQKSIDSDASASLTAASPMGGGGGSLGAGSGFGGFGGDSEDSDDDLLKLDESESAALSGPRAVKKGAAVYADLRSNDVEVEYVWNATLQANVPAVKNADVDAWRD